SHIDDVAPIIASSIGNPSAYNEVFNIGADKPYSVKELATIVCESFGVPEALEFLEARNEVDHAYSDHAKVRSYFGSFFKNVDLKEGIERMVEDAKAKGPRQGEKFKGIEIEKNMPPAWKKLI
ncbi:MAG: hypothetical protein RIC15_09335, partial [Vicingaceae bacterium]